MMVARQKRGNAGRWLRPVIVITTVLMLLGCTASVATAASKPKTVKGAAYQLMKQFMQQYDKCGFAKVVDAGRPRYYQRALSDSRVVVDRSITGLAEFDPNANTIKLKRDPRLLKKAQRLAMGETVWHEVTHAIEHAYGDPDRDVLWNERNIAYMTHVYTSAVPWLWQMEKKAKAGASVKVLRRYWDKFLQYIDKAERLEETKAYPPDLALLRGWFGFRTNPAEVKKLYLSGKVLRGKKGKNLRKMLRTAPTKQPPKIGDTYQGGTVFYILRSGDAGYVAGQTHGLIVSTAGFTSVWDPAANACAFAAEPVVTGARNTAINRGGANTQTIIAKLGADPSAFPSPAAAVATFHRGGGYDDWYLPTIEDLRALQRSRNAVSGIPNGLYWTSCEHSSYRAYAYDFGHPQFAAPATFKGEEALVRPVRTF